MNDQRTRPTRTRAKRAGVALIASGLLLGAVTTAAGASNASKVAQARKSLLVLSDMPQGWTSSKSSNSSGSFPGAKQLAHCLGVPTSVITSNPPTANSPEFNSKNQLLSVDDSVSIYSSPNAARADFASLANVRTPSCLTTVLNGTAKAALEKGFGSGAKVGAITVTRTPAADYAPHSANFTMFFPVTEQGTTVNVELSLVDFVKGKKEQTVTFIAVQSTFPTAMALHLTTVAAGRI